MSTNCSQQDLVSSGLEESGQTRPSRWSFLPLVAFTLCFYTATIAQYSVLPQYIFHRFLEEKGLPASYSNASYCNINKSDPQYVERQNVQAEATLVNTKAMLLELIPSILMVFIFGSYSDEMGRKVTIFVPYCGGAVLSICICLMINLDLPIYVYFIGSFVNGFSGSYGTMLSGVFAFLADTTTKRNRSLAMGMMEASLGLSVVLSQFTIGYWLKSSGPKSPMIAITSLICFSAVFMLCLRDSIPRRSNYYYQNSGILPVRVLRSLKRQFERIKSVFSVDRLRGLCLALCIAAFSLHILCYIGSMSIMTLYLLNEPFCWTSELIGVFSGSKAAFWQLSMVITVLLLRNRMPDWHLACIGFVSYTGYNILVATASSFELPLDNIFLIAAVVAGIGNGLCGTMIRTLCSKLVVQEEQGVVFAAIAGSETVAIGLGAATLNPMYAATLKFFSGFVFVFIAFLSVVGLCLVIFAHRISQRRAKFVSLVEVPSPP